MTPKKPSTPDDYLAAIKEQEDIKDAANKEIERIKGEALKTVNELVGKMGGRVVFGAEESKTKSKGKSAAPKPGKKDDVIKWLKTELADNPQPFKTVAARLKEELSVERFLPHHYGETIDVGTDKEKTVSLR